MKIDNSKLNVDWEKFKVKDDIRYEENKRNFLNLASRAWTLLGMEIASDYRGSYIPVTIKNNRFSMEGNLQTLINKLDIYESYLEQVEKEGDKLVEIKGLTHRNEFIFRLEIWDGINDGILEFNRFEYNNFIKIRRKFYEKQCLDIESLRNKYPIDWSKMKIHRKGRYEDGKKNFLKIIMESWDLFGLELRSDYKRNSDPIVLKNDKFTLEGTAVSIFKKFESHKNLLKKLEEEKDKLIDIIELSDRSEIIYRVSTYDSKNGEHLDISATAYYKFINGRKKFYSALNSNGHVAKSIYLGTEKNIEIDYGCEHENEITNPHNYLNCPKCKYCLGIKVIEGETDVATTHPETIKYFLNREDATKFSFGSEAETQFRCLDCGNIETRKISSVVQNGIRCRKCYDNISFPQKVMNNLLYQLKDNGVIDDFDTEYNPSWTDRPYDNAFVYNDDLFIVENHGKQHYEESARGRSLEQEQYNDKLKYERALCNGISKENYIVIDARESEIEYIKKSILESRLSQIFNLNNIDWNDCYEKALKNLVKATCDLYDKEGLNVPMISEKLKLGKTTVRRYLRRGETLGWCLYEPEKDRLKNQKSASKGRRARVVCLNTGEEFKSIKAAAEAFKINPSSISAVCRGRSYFGGRDEDNKVYYVWAKKDDYLKMSEDDIKNKIEKACKIGERN